AGDAVDGGDEGLVEIARVVQAAEPASAPVLVGLLPRGGALQVPAGTEEAVAGAGHDRDAQRRIVPERGEHRIQPPARREVDGVRSEEHTSELQSRGHLVCRLLLEKKNKTENPISDRTSDKK